MMKNIASFNIRFTKQFCVVSRSGFEAQEFDTEPEARDYMDRTLSSANRTVALYGEGERNLIERRHRNDYGVYVYVRLNAILTSEKPAIGALAFADDESSDETYEVIAAVAVPPCAPNVALAYVVTLRGVRYDGGSYTRRWGVCDATLTPTWFEARAAAEQFAKERVLTLRQERRAAFLPVAHAAHEAALRAATAEGGVVTLPCECACGVWTISSALPACEAVDLRVVA